MAHATIQQDVVAIAQDTTDQIIVNSNGILKRVSVVDASNNVRMSSLKLDDLRTLDTVISLISWRD